MALPWLRRLTSPAAKWTVAVSGVAAVAAPLSIAALHHPGQLRVATAQVTDGPIVRRIIATGTLQAVTTVQVGAQVSGTIESLGADFNSFVRTGQVVATLEPSLFRAARDQAAATLAAADAAERQAVATQNGFATAVIDARTKLTRAEQLAAKQLIAPSDLDSARIAFASANADLQSSAAQVAAARAAVQQAQAALAQATVNLERTIIRSPLDGIVVSRNVDVGQTLQSSMQAPVLFSIAADLRHIQMEVDIDESDIAGVAPGEEVSFEVESYPNDEFSGTVAAVRLQPVAEQTATAASIGTGATSAATPTTTIASVISYATIVDVPNPDEKLRPGMTATVTLRGARRDQAVRIPTAALSFRPPTELVGAQVAGDGDASRRVVWEYDGRRFIPEPVRVGLADDRWTEMIDGVLHAGDALVTSASFAR